jgi:BirA family biotin operon repressor/biotin-[acetyl-CoA-carboxylase] ligase
MAIFTLWMGVNLCELITNLTHLKPGLKWPNDILFDGRKAGGMLTEARVDADQIRDLIFGLGLNVNGPANAWPAELSRHAVSLSERTSTPLDLNHFTAALIGRVLLAYEQFVEGDHAATFADLWKNYDVLRSHPVALLQGNRRVAGTAMGIDDQGSLLIRSENGRLQRFHAGDVTIEKQP